MFSPEELKNLLAIINSAQIKGTDATTVALLQQKISKLLNPPKEEKDEEKKEE